jgi:DNA-binding CsgD family transcriptional regulator
LDKSKLNIAFIDTPIMIIKGLSGALQLTGKQFNVCCHNNLQSFLKSPGCNSQVLAIINPNYLHSNLKEFIQIKNTYPSVKWIGVLYTVFAPDILEALDDTIRITDSYETIKCIIDRQACEENTTADPTTENRLTPRETEIIKLVLAGLTSKQIASKLYISFQTVLSHRKEIFRKAKVHNHHELLNYSLSNKIISLENLRME